MKLSDDDDKKLGAGIDYFADRMHLAFAVFFAMAEFREREAISSEDWQQYSTW